MVMEPPEELEELSLDEELSPSPPPVTVSAVHTPPFWHGFGSQGSYSVMTHTRILKGGRIILWGIIP